ncbi:MAG: hypothetical protein Q3974_06150 [Rothia sp. (in: high G+C Gram-positive bacteria)]|nr:hypothetical protein [Rothia sp. (in: high G+C Gram-positive bacteria)]
MKITHTPPRKNKKSAKTLTTLALVAGSALTATLTAAPAQAYTTTGTFRNYGVSQYHVYSNGIDWSQPVGVIFYLDGDYWENYQSKIYSPNTNNDLNAMAKIANDRNMLLVPVISPDKDKSGDGITWWQNMQGNAAYFRDFANWFINATKTDRSNVWTIGYSGGAEIEAFELNARSQESWRTGGGSIMVGGGNSNGVYTAPSAHFKRMPMDWYVGYGDGAGGTWPQTWSAWGAAHAGNSIYRNSGFSNTSLTPTAGDHYAYNFPWILEKSLNEAGVQKRSQFTLRGAIGNYYYAHSSALGAPTTNEFATVDGGAAQNFRNNTTVYWTASSGAHAVYFNGGIGAAYRAGGYENGYGYPMFDETGIPGGAMQKFKNISSGKVTAFYWAPNTGTYKVWEPGAIGARFTREGGTGTYGFPVANESAMPAGGATQIFRKTDGSETVFYWSAKTGTHTLVAKGGLNNAFRNWGSVEKYGYPTTDETLQKDGTVTVKFNKGKTLSWSPVTGRVSELTQN